MQNFYLFSTHFVWISFGHTELYYIRKDKPILWWVMLLIFLSKFKVNESWLSYYSEGMEIQRQRYVEYFRQVRQSFPQYISPVVFVVSNMIHTILTFECIQFIWCLISVSCLLVALLTHSVNLKAKNLSWKHRYYQQHNSNSVYSGRRIRYPWWFCLQ